MHRSMAEQLQDVMWSRTVHTAADAPKCVRCAKRGGRWATPYGELCRYCRAYYWKRYMRSRRHNA